MSASCTSLEFNQMQPFDYMRFKQLFIHVYLPMTTLSSISSYTINQSQLFTIIEWIDMFDVYTACILN